MLRERSGKQFAFLLPLGVALLWILWRQVPRSLPVPEVLAAEPVPVSGASLTLSAEQILARSTDIYRNCRSFREAGYVQNEDVEGGSSTVTDQARFRVTLERPARMTWQWRRRHRQFHDDEFTTLLRDGTAVQLSSDLHRETVTSSDLSTALEVDHREARDLLSRLLPEESARAAFDSEGARLEGVELVNARPCFRIGRVYPTPDPARHAAVTWWIDSESFLLRRSLRVVEFQDRTLRTTTAFEPELDPTLSPADFTPIEL